MALRQAPLRRSLARHNTVMGAERTPVLIVMLAAAMLIFTGLTVVTTLLGIVVGVVGIVGLRVATRVHPQITSVYTGFIKYHKHYPARMTYPAPMPHKHVISLGEQDG